MDADTSMGESVVTHTLTRKGASRRRTRAQARARMQRRLVVCLFAVSLPVVALLAAGWMAWWRGDVVVEISVA